MKLLILSYLFYSSFSFSSVSSGQMIQAKQYNNATHQIGDVKQSVLTTTQFSGIHGDCWRLMDGSSIVGSDLSNLTGKQNVPNATTEGTFFRQLPQGSDRTIGDFQADENKEHNHIQSPHFHYDSTGYGGGGYWGSTQLGAGNSFFNHSDGFASNANKTNSVTAINQNSGGAESRPKNISLNFFIKINNNCN